MVPPLRTARSVYLLDAVEADLLRLVREESNDLVQAIAPILAYESARSGRLASPREYKLGLLINHLEAIEAVSPTGWPANAGLCEQNNAMAKQNLKAKDTIEVLEFGWALWGAFEDSRADGKVNLLDAPRFIPALTKAIPAINDIENVVDEILDPEASAEVIAYVRQKFDIADDEAEALIENTFSWVLGGVGLAGQWIPFIRKRKEGK